MKMFLYIKTWSLFPEENTLLLPVVLKFEQWLPIGIYFSIILNLKKKTYERKQKQKT